MKPPRLRYILAHTAGISTGLGVTGALAILLVSLHSQGVIIPHSGVILWVILASLPVSAIGYVVGLAFIWRMFLAPLAAGLQGWPFAVGDKVRILSGPRKDTISTVYEVWAERGQVRVDLGPEAGEKLEDVYCAVAVCRVRHTEPNGSATRVDDLGDSEDGPGSAVAEAQLRRMAQSRNPWFNQPDYPNLAGSRRGSPGSPACRPTRSRAVTGARLSPSIACPVAIATLRRPRTLPM